jgi:hypothetical protein
MCIPHRYKPWTTALAAAGLLTLPGLAQADTGTNVPTTLGGTPIGVAAHESFWKRFDDINRADLSTPCYTPPAPGAPATPPTRRGNPAPFDSPPYPTGDWQIGGTPIIGDANITPDYPLMETIYESKYGQAWAKSRIKFYGWEDFSANISSSNNKGDNGAPSASGLNGNNGDGNNFPEVYDQRSDRFEQNQFVLYAERTPDESQTDHVDWGFRFSQVYGLDYRYMISRGWNDEQLTHYNAFYGTDNPMMYFNLYIPNVAQGLNLTIGRIISEADIEAQLAPNNLMSSHSLLYGFDPYCQWGVFGTLKLSKNWVIQLGPSAGNDVTPWETQDPGCEPTLSAMLQYQSDNNKFSFYGGGNCINNAHWGFNNIQQYVGTFTYKFSEKIWMTHETWYMYQTECPAQPSKDHPFGVAATDEPAGQVNALYGGPPTKNGFGYTDGSYPVHPGFCGEWATLNYTMFRLAPGLFFTVRNELFDDNSGQRTGFATLYSEHSMGLTWWPNKLITIRPELRYDRTYGTHGNSFDPTISPSTGAPIDEAKPFDNGTRRQQVTAQFDVIYHF